jgi:methylated-DNA-[protein]-cysteine S-methyltransferase
MEAVCFLNTPLGVLQVSASEAGLVRVVFVSAEARSLPLEVETPLLAEACRQLTAYFDGRLTTFDLPLAPAGTAFQQRVWQAVRQVPFGQTTTYAAIAASLSNPGAARAVGAANGQNPLWLLIPCHRIIGRTGSLSGYAGGLHRKQWLLLHEAHHAEATLFSGFSSPT